MLFVFTLNVCLSLVLSQEVFVNDSEKVKTCFESNAKEIKECTDFFASVTQTLSENTIIQTVVNASKVVGDQSSVRVSFVVSLNTLI
jgi:hypothetical protein